MTTRRLEFSFVITLLAVSAPFTFIHLVARPDDAPISPLQRLVAALANYFGPWGVAIVRIVDFPNAGLRSFSWTLALMLTAIGIALFLLSLRTKRPPLQYALVTSWALFSLVWFAVGLMQIASGLL